MRRSIDETDFFEEWRKWGEAVIEYSKASSYPSAGLRHSLRDIPPGVNSDDYLISFTHGMFEFWNW